MAENDEKVATIRRSLVAAWQIVSLRTDCSGFLKNIFSSVYHITLVGRANDIILFIATNWTPVSSAVLAEQEASQGVFVVALLKGPDHVPPREEGHVAVVLPGPLQRRGVGPTGGAYPLVWCGGGLGGSSDGTKTVGDVWRPVDRNKVKYYKYVPR